MTYGIDCTMLYAHRPYTMVILKYGRRVGPSVLPSKINSMIENSFGAECFFYPYHAKRFFRRHRVLGRGFFLIAEGFLNGDSALNR